MVDIPVLNNPKKPVLTTPQKAIAKKRHYRLFIFDDYIYNKKSDGLNMRRTLLSGPKSHNIRTHFTKEDFKC